MKSRTAGAATWRDELEAILAQRGACEALDSLVKAGCDREQLEVRLTMLNWRGRTGDAARRRDHVEDAGKLARCLKKAEGLAVRFHSTVEPLPRPGSILPIMRLGAATADHWRSVDVPLFNPRNHQQFNLVDWVCSSTKKPHYSELETLLRAAGHASRVPEKDLPTANSLETLVSKFRKNQKAWSKSRAKKRL
jgi:hypothetical protein